MASVAGALVCSSCGFFYDGPDFEEIKSAIVTHGDSLVALETMLAEDYRGCMQHGARSPYDTSPSTIGIGPDYACGFELDGGLWSETRGTGRYAADPDTLLVGLGLSQMLDSAGLTEERYGRYLGLLDLLNARSVVFGVDNDRRLIELRIAYWGAATSSWDLWVGRYAEPPHEVVSDVMATKATGCTLLESEWYLCQRHT